MQSTPPPSTAESTTSPLPLKTDSSSTYANDPLLSLLRPALHQMSQDQVREEVNKLRNLRVNGQKLGAALREGAAREAAKPPVQKQQSLDDLMKGLGL